MKNKVNKPQDSVKNLLTYFGEDINRSGLKETPDRIVRMYDELLGGYKKDIKSIFKKFDSNDYHHLITASNINFYSLCEHHMIPFFGKVHIGYIPNSKILGLSKFLRLVDVYARRLQTQENLTKQIFDSIKKNLHPKGLVVRIEAEHLCVSMRGIKKKGFIVKTTISDGQMKKRKDLIRQFYEDIANEN